jgi:CheY-like chemotaxis protein
MEGPPPFLNPVTHEREKNLAYLREALAELVQPDDILNHGFASHLLPRSISHALRVCLIANHDHRLAEAARSDGLGAREAARLIQQEDGKRLRWTRSLFDRDPYDPRLYDVVIAMQSATPDEAIGRIVENARKPAVAATAASRAAAVGFLLAARVGVVLAEKGIDCDVSAEGGHVSVAINRYTARLEQQQRKIEALARGVPGVESVSSSPGIKFVPPALVKTPDVDLPTKVLLVDDERDFVHTLSERLQTRQLDSAVVYDGEEALAFIENEPPEVMVLDLKMPGINGLEVLRRVKRSHPQVEVIILTGHGSDKEENMAKELGAFAYLKKPVDIDVLAETMKAAYRKVGRAGPDDGDGA